MIQFIVVSSSFLQDYISFILFLDFFFVVFSFVIVVLENFPYERGVNLNGFQLLQTSFNLFMGPLITYISCFLVPQLMDRSMKTRWEVADNLSIPCHITVGTSTNPSMKSELTRWCPRNWKNRSIVSVSTLQELSSSFLFPLLCFGSTDLWNSCQLKTGFLTGFNALRPCFGRS